MVVRTPPGRAQKPIIPRISTKARRLFAGFVLTGICFAAFWPPSLKDQNPVARELLNSGHLPAFATLMFVIWLVLPDSRSNAYRLRRAIGVSSILVVAIEIAQPMVGRTASSWDLFHGLAGILLVAVVIGLRGRVKRVLFWPAGALVGSFLVGWLAVPAAGVAFDIKAFEEQFPVLGDFEAEHEMRWWRASNGGRAEDTRVERSEEYAATGAHALKVVTGKGTWAGVTMPAAVPDWRGHESLALHLYNPGEGFVLHLRIDDARDGRGFHQRFNAVTDIGHGENLVEFELNGQRNPRFRFEAVTRLILFTGRRQPSRTFYLDQVQLR